MQRETCVFALCTIVVLFLHICTVSGIVLIVDQETHTELYAQVNWCHQSIYNHAKQNKNERNFYFRLFRLSRVQRHKDSLLKSKSTGPLFFLRFFIFSTSILSLGNCFTHRHLLFTSSSVIRFSVRLAVFNSQSTIMYKSTACSLTAVKEFILLRFTVYTRMFSDWMCCLRSEHRSL